MSDFIKIKTLILILLTFSTGLLAKSDQPLSTPAASTSDEDADTSATTITDDIYRVIYNSIFVDTTLHRSLELGEHFVEAHEPYLPFSGKTIRNIYIKQVPIFGSSVYDTAAVKQTLLTRSAESVHIHTQERVIENNLLFATGDTIDAFRIADNARLLRSLNFINDANILIIPLEDSKELVDVLIISQDVFSLGVSGSVSSRDNFRINLFDRNLFGLGWEVNNIFHHNGLQSPAWGYDGRFSISNINRSFISAYFNYINTFDIEGIQLGATKPFLTPETEYGGGIEISNSRVFINQENIRSLNHSVTVQDYWLGHSFPLPDPEHRRNITFSARVIDRSFTVRPAIKPDSNHVFHDETLLLTALFLSEVNYFKSRMILGFGHTEDVPYGYNFNLTGGYAESEFENRWYGGIRLQAASFWDDVGYLLGGLSAGSFYDGRRFENGIIRLDLYSFTDLIDLGADYHLRQFFKLNHTIGITRLDDDQLNMDPGSYLREFVSDQYYGTQRLSFGVESVVFSPWNWFGFRYAIVGFADFGWIGSNHRTPDITRLSSVFGFSFRLRNESLVLSTFQIGFAFYPHSPDGNDHFNWRFTTSEPKIFRRLGSKKPQLIPYE